MDALWGPFEQKPLKEMGEFIGKLEVSNNQNVGGPGGPLGSGTGKCSSTNQLFPPSPSVSLLHSFAGLLLLLFFLSHGYHSSFPFPPIPSIQQH